MDQILGGIRGVICYLEDILISSNSKEEHLRVLVEVLKRLKENGVKAKNEKRCFGQSSVTYLYLIIDAKGIHPTKEKVQVILKATNTTKSR